MTSEFAGLWGSVLIVAGVALSWPLALVCGTVLVYRASRST